MMIICSINNLDSNKIVNENLTKLTTFIKVVKKDDWIIDEIIAAFFLYQDFLDAVDSEKICISEWRDSISLGYDSLVDLIYEWIEFFDIKPNTCKTDKTLVYLADVISKEFYL